MGVTGESLWDIRDGSPIREMLEFNAVFAGSGAALSYQSDKRPRKKVAVLTCMDTRLTALLPAALGLKGGDVKMIKNAGGLILNPLDSTVRSLLIAVLELGVEEIMVIGHTDCGVQGMDERTVVSHMVERGISRRAVLDMKAQGLDFHQWFTGFENPQDSVRDSVKLLRNHPLMPEDVAIYGFVMDIGSGELKRAV